MTDLYFDTHEELEKFLKDKPFLGQGCEGRVYKFGDYSLKIYPESCYNPNYYLRFKDVDVNNFYFKKNVVFLEQEKVIGTISNYAKGETLDYSYLYNVPIDNLIKSLEILLRDIKEISKKNISLEDAIFIKNIVYDGFCFKFIDTNTYFYDFDNYNLYKKNVLEVMRELMFSITNSSLKDSFLNYYINKINPRYNYYLDYELLLNPINLLKKLKYSLEEFCEEEIISFKDCEKNIKKKIKKC